MRALIHIKPIDDNFEKRQLINNLLSSLLQLNSCLNFPVIYDIQVDTKIKLLEILLGQDFKCKILFVEFANETIEKQYQNYLDQEIIRPHYKLYVDIEVFKNSLWWKMSTIRELQNQILQNQNNGPRVFGGNNGIRQQGVPVCICNCEKLKVKELQNQLAKKEHHEIALKTREKIVTAELPLSESQIEFKLKEKLIETNLVLTKEKLKYQIYSNSSNRNLELTRLKYTFDLEKLSKQQEHEWNCKELELQNKIKSNSLTELVVVKVSNRIVIGLFLLFLICLAMS